MSALSPERQSVAESGFVTAARDDHRRLSRKSADLRGVCSRPVVEADLKLLAGIGARLESLRSDILAHFEREERDGYLAEVISERPDLTIQVNALLDEHAEIREELGVLVTIVDEPEPELIARVIRLLDFLEGHEQRETALWQKATLTDFGG